MRILLVEDDVSLADGLATALRREGWTVDHVPRGQDALLAIRNEAPNLVILDLGLPDIDGLEVLEQLQRTEQHPMVLVLTARDRTEDKVSGLNLGADDYLAKPFEMPELLARLRALERRASVAPTVEISIGAVTLDTVKPEIRLDGEPLDLTRRELMLLKLLMENAGRILSREQLETSLYGWGEELASNSIEVHIHNLRKKVGSDFIRTVRGIGYTVQSP